MELPLSATWAIGSIRVQPFPHAVPQSVDNDRVPVLLCVRQNGSSASSVPKKNATPSARSVQPMRRVIAAICGFCRGQRRIAQRAVGTAIDHPKPDPARTGATQPRTNGNPVGRPLRGGDRRGEHLAKHPPTQRAAPQQWHTLLVRGLVDERAAAMAADGAMTTTSGMAVTTTPNIRVRSR